METLKNKLKKIKPEIIYMAIEYIIGIWVIVVTIINLLNLLEMIGVYSGFMKPTFFGASLLILLLLQYGLMRANKGNGILNKIRPYVMGLTMANVVSTGKMSLCLMLLLVVGYFLVSGLLRKCSPKEAALTMLLACVGIELYSIVFLLLERETYGGAEAFLKSLWPDVLFIGAAFLYYFADRPVSTDDEEKHQSKRTLRRKRESLAVMQKLSAWYRTDTMRLMGWIGNAICIISMGLFMYFSISVGVGAQKISRGEEEVYLLRHCEDIFYVLTLEQEETGEYNFSFQKYAGTNNQKIHLRDVGNGMYQLIFLSPNYAIGINSQIMPYAEPEGDSALQYWVKETYDGENGLYRFVSSYGVPLCYSELNKEESYLSVGNHDNDCDVFVLEKTTGEEFVTRMAVKYRDEFMPTMLMETCSTLLGSWTSVLYILVMATFFGIVYLRRILGDKLAMLYALFFAYLLAYGAISAIALLFLAIGLQCGCNYYRKQVKNLGKACEVTESAAEKGASTSLLKET